MAAGTLSKNGQGSGSSALTTFDPSSGALVRLRFLWVVRPVYSYDACLQVGPSSLQQQLAAESLYRDANSLLYADNKPSEEAVDRVISKINKEYVLRDISIVS